MIAPAASTVPRLALTAAEAAESLGVSERHLQALAVAGSVPSVMLGQRRVFPVGAWEDFLRRRCTQWLADEPQQEVGQ
jgi:excisionase family DNA binding protein